MKKIQDRIFLGFVAGILGAIPGRFINKIEFGLGLTDSRYEEMAALLFVNKRDLDEAKGKNVGRIANSLLASVLGVITTYVISRTGRDYAIFKGMGVTSLAWLGVYGLSTQSQIRKSKKPGVALLSFFDHLIFGATAATLVLKLGDDSLFPSKNKQCYQQSTTEDSIPNVSSFPSKNRIMEDEYKEKDLFRH
jgi:hypothetical protein